MKFLKLLLLLLSLSVLSANAEVYNVVEKIDDEILESKEGSEVKASLKLPKAKRIPFAAIIVVSEIKEFSKSNASLTLFIDDKEVGAATIYNSKGERSTVIVATREFREAVKANKESIDVKILMRGQNQSVLKIKSIGAKIVHDEKHFRNSTYIRPIFSGDEVTAESVFPLGNEQSDKPASAKLLFAPTEILEAYTFSSGKKVELEKDKDFRINGDSIEFIPTGAVKIIPYKDFYADTKEDAMRFCQKPFYFRNIKKFAFFAEGDWFHKHMVYISYKHALNDEKVGEKFDEKILPNTLSLLKAKKPLRMVLFGDSISHGANASGKSLTAPYCPSWGDFVAQELYKYYKTPIIFFNRSLGGMTSNWGATEVSNLVSPDKPDLVIIAFGMNDRIAKEKFKENLQTMISEIRKVNPAAEIILVSSMMANPNWVTIPMHDEQFACRELESKGIAFADVRAVHKRLLQQKRFVDMTGNNVNHPNDFLIRIYAQTILQKLIPTMSK